ncbi:MAG: sialidase family protein [Bryobacteraceae bacterium]
MLTRRVFLGACGSAAIVPAAQIRREIFLASSVPGSAALVSAYYVRPAGGDMVSIESRMSRSDTVDSVYYRYSSDYGRTWSAPSARLVTEKRPNGAWRKAPRGVFVDPTGIALEFWMEATLPTDDPLEGLRRWTIWYSVSTDGGRSQRLSRQIVHHGAGFTPEHPLPGVYIGKNSYMLGDITSVPIWLPDGSLLLPAMIAPLAADGTSLYNPSNAYTYHDTAILHARWKGGELVWELRGQVASNPERSTRGYIEPTLGLLKDGRLLVVMRGSNDRRHELPSYRWVAFSKDQGRTFSTPVPWTYANGESFFSPSSCSQLVAHSSGRLFWLGNITPTNPKGNRPRYPFVICEVDRASGLLRKETLRTVDDLQSGEDPVLTLSNFYAREDRQSGDIHLHMTRLFASSEKPWKGDAYLYRIPING